MKTLSIFFAIVYLCFHAHLNLLANSNHVLMGPYPGLVTHNSAEVWVGLQVLTKDIPSTKTTYTISWNEDGKWYNRDAELKLTPSRYLKYSFFYGKYPIQGLKPNTKYELKLRYSYDDSDKKELKKGSFKTFQHPDFSGNFSFIVYSCVGSGRERDRFAEAMSHIWKDHDDISFLVSLGDNGYPEESSPETHMGSLWLEMAYRSAQSHSTKDRKDVEKVYQNTPVYYTWDNHDFIQNGRFNKIKKERKEREKLFRELFTIPKNQERGGIYHKFSFGSVDFYMLDTWYFKSIHEAKTLGTTQWKWLKSDIEKSNAKLIFLCSSAIYPEVDYEKGTNKHPYKRFNYGYEDNYELFQLLMHKKNIVFLSGDIHRCEYKKRKVKLRYLPGWEHTDSIQMPEIISSGIGKNSGRDGVKQSFVKVEVNAKHGIIIFRRYNYKGEKRRWHIDGDGNKENWPFMIKLDYSADQDSSYWKYWEIRDEKVASKMFELIKTDE